MDCCFRRARKPEEKDQRRGAILAAARTLAREVGPIELSLNELGRRSGVSKPNIYRYFESREEILLHLFVAELDELTSALEAELAPRELSIGKLTATIVREFLARPLFCQLLGMVASILEHNLSAEAIALAKRDMHGHSARAAAALGHALPWLTPEDAAWLTQTIALYVAGLWPATHPSKAAAEVMARPEFAPFRPDAARDLERFVELLLYGLEAQRVRAPRKAAR
jgi:AcrR family transcriptional regulator